MKTIRTWEIQLNDGCKLHFKSSEYQQMFPFIYDPIYRGEIYTYLWKMGYKETDVVRVDEIEQEAII